MRSTSKVPRAWRNQDIILFHGTTSSAADAIQKNGIELAYCKPGRDFGRGFYTTTILHQAGNWAQDVANRRVWTDPNQAPAILSFRLSRQELGSLQSLGFVNSEDRAEDFWSFLHFCRQGATNHFGASPRKTFSGTRAYYDVVFGPVSAFGKQCVAMQAADQISFHTEAAISLLNRVPKKRIIVKP